MTATPEQEPVAWLYERPGSDWYELVRKRDPDPEYLASEGWIETALYAQPTTPDPVHPAPAPSLVEAVKAALDYADGCICRHEEGTHRGGAIWTICDTCGAQWADDRGGFKPSRWPALFDAAAEAIAALSVTDPAIEELRVTLEQVRQIVEDEAYKVTAGQQPCKHTAALNMIHGAVSAALQEQQP